MHDIYSQVESSSRNPIVVPSTGASIDSNRQQYMDSLVLIQTHLSELISMGCVDAHIHFKSDGKTMFMNRPADETGQRKYIHVGVNPEKQKTARDQVYRERKRKGIQSEVDSLNYKARQLDRQLGSLLWEYGRLLSDAAKVQELCNQPNYAGASDPDEG